MPLAVRANGSSSLAPVKMPRAMPTNRLRRVSAYATVPRQPLQVISATSLEASRVFLRPRPNGRLEAGVKSPGQTPMHSPQYRRRHRLHRAAVLHHASDLMLHPHSQQSVTARPGTSKVAPSGSVSLDFSRHQRQRKTRPAGVCAPAPEHLLQRPVPHPQTSSGFGSKQTWHRSSRSRKRAKGDSGGAAVNRRLSARLGRGMSPCDTKTSFRGSSSFSGSSVEHSDRKEFFIQDTSSFL